MKFFYYCCFALILCDSVYTTTSGEFLIKNVDMLKQYEKANYLRVKSAVLKVCPAVIEDKIQQTYMKMRECFYNYNLEYETICFYVKNHTEQCTKPFISMLEECLQDKSKDIPAFLIKSLLSTSEYICKIDGEHLFELQNPCVLKQNQKTKRCLLKMQSRLQQYELVTPSKTEICELLKSMKYCLRSHLEESCGHPVTRESIMGAYEATVSVCEDNSEKYVNEI